MFMLLIDAALIGVIIALLEQEDFPGWGPMLGTALLIGLASGAANHWIDGILGVIAGFAVAGLVGAVLIAWICGMSFGRAALATAIYLGLRLAIVLAVFWMEQSAGLEAE